ncbi:MAG: hypothetical protein ACU0DI_07475 [Paracoccaceae bacterium]
MYNVPPNFMQTFFARPPVVDEKTFVLWEPCTHSHGEIVPGYTKYLLDLGYNVLVLMTPARLSEGLFSRFCDPRATHGWLSQRRIRKFVKTANFRKSAGILITTAGKLPVGADKSIDLERVFGSQLPKQVLLVEHDASQRIEAGVWDVHSITLREIFSGGQKSIVVNPHSFGHINVTPKTKDKTKFLMVGAGRAKRGNQSLVFDSVERMLAAGVRNFEIRLVGRKGSEKIPEEIRPYVHTLGRVSFDQLYREAESADFILTSFQRDNPDHGFYRTTGTSGSFQLAYGFQKPCIVQGEFARGTVLSKENSLFYESDKDLEQAMVYAVQMNGDEYHALQAAMDADAKALYTQSLRNLKTLIHD